MKTRHLKVKRALVHHGLTARCHLCGHLLEIDFVYLEFRLEDSRCENSASQQVLSDERRKSRASKRGRSAGTRDRATHQLLKMSHLVGGCVVVLPDHLHPVQEAAGQRKEKRTRGG